MSAGLAVEPGMGLAALGIELRLWLFDLDAWDGAADGLPDVVTQRATRFVRDVDRRRYLASQAALRRVLGVCQAPWLIGTHGKPALADGPPHFNLSRRDRWALVGVSSTHELGVDIETLRAIDDAQELARLHFTPRERDAVTDTETFLQIWTRKEACVKATGLGLSLPPSLFECGAELAPARVRIATPSRNWLLMLNTPNVAAPAVVSWAVVLA